MAISYSQWSKRDLCRTLFRFKWRGSLVFIGVLTLAVTGLIVCPREYVSEAKLLVRLGRENMALDPTVANGQIVSINSTREAEINSVIQSLASRTNIEKVLDEVGAETDIAAPLDRERALISLTRDITLYAPKNSTVVVLSCMGSSPERARRIASTLLEVCLKEHVRINRAPGSQGFFDEQTAILKGQLDAASAAFRDAKNRYGVVTLEGRRASLQQQLSTVELQQQETAAALAASEAKVRETVAKIEQLPAPLLQQMVGGAPNNGLGDMRQKLYELQTLEQQLLLKKSEQHPEVLAIRQLVQESRRILDEETPRHNDSATALLVSEKGVAAGLRARAESLGEQHRELTLQLHQLNNVEPELIELERQVRLLDANYVTYIKGLEQSRVDEALKNEGLSNLSIIQYPSLVPKPAVPQVGLTLLVAMCAACGGAIGVMLLSEHWDESIHNASAAERQLRLKVLASLPRVKAAPKPPAADASHEHWRAYV